MYTYVYMISCIFMYVYMHALYTHTYIHMYIHTYNVYIHVYMYIYIHVYAPIACDDLSWVQSKKHILSHFLESQVSFFFFKKAGASISYCVVK
jgi:hypothetical protein